MGKIIGIDLGTTSSCVAVMEGGQPTVIPNQEGALTTPSVVGFNPKTQEWLVGTPAQRQSINLPSTTYHSVLRLIGIQYSSVSLEKTGVAFTVDRSEAGRCLIDVVGKKISPERIIAMILGKLKESAEIYLGEGVSDAAIAVPSYFTDVQRRATIEAAAIVGLNVKRILSSTSAASMAYGFDKGIDGTIAMLDLGGGSFDLSLLEMSEGVFEVKSVNGDTTLGGDDLDQTILDWLVTKFIQAESIDLRRSPEAVQRIREASQKAKIELSTTRETEIDLPYISGDGINPKHLRQSLSRAQFELLTGSLIQRLKAPCENAMKDAKLSRHEIDKVILIGGSGRIPMIQELVKQIFGKEAYLGLNRSETVALGAAVFGGLLMGDVKGMLLLDVTPFSLGIKADGGQMSVIIPRNTTIPTKRSEVYTTTTDNQLGIDIEVFQGERPVVEGNTSIGNNHFQGISPAPKGLPQIEVIFDIDANGLVNITAKDKGTGIELASGSSNRTKAGWKTGSNQTVDQDKTDRDTQSDQEPGGKTDERKQNPFAAEITGDPDRGQWSGDSAQRPSKPSWVARLLGR